MYIFSFISALVIILGIFVVVQALYNSKNAKHKRKGKYSYIYDQYGEQMELDLRLPYKRFKQLYPENKWTYEEYKAMQKKTAFRRSHSSQDNKRMVR